MSILKIQLSELISYAKHIYKKVSSQPKLQIVTPQGVRRFQFYYLMSRRPLIITLYGAIYDIEEMVKSIKNEKAYFLLGFWWHLESEENAKTLNSKYLEFRSKYSQHEIIFMCNSPRQYDLLGKYNLPRVYCNQNCFLDDTLFTVLPGIQKKYTCVYNARASPFKRHQLAKKINDLALVTYDIDHHPFKERRANFYKLKNTLPEAIMLNWRKKPLLKDLFYRSGMPYVSTKHVVEYLNQSRVGIMLSEAEGACYASAEYLLCGLPLVTTKSIGGRDVFYDEAYTLVVDDTPEAVCEGVNQMIEKDIPPEYIRSETLKKMRPHRERFMKLVQSIYDKEEVKRDFRKEWGNVFIHKMNRVEENPISVYLK